MFCHIRPKIFTTLPVRLVDFEVEQFGLNLRGDIDLSIGRPYPNKTYSVAYRKGRKHLDGLVLSLPPEIAAFSTVTRWAVAAETLVTHRVDYTLLDADFDLASDSMYLWYAYSGKSWKNRFPRHLKRGRPVRCEPTMMAEPLKEAPFPRENVINKKFDDRGWLVFLHHAFAMPTIEPERLWNDNTWEVNRRAPSRESAYKLS